MKKYRVTRRGKIVFGTIIILLALGAYYFFTDNGNENSNLDKEVLTPIEVGSDPNDQNFSEEQEEETSMESEEETENLESIYSEEEMKALQSACFRVFYEPNEYYVPKDNLKQLLEFTNIAIKYKDEYIIIEGNANLLGEEEERDSISGKDAGYDRALVIKNYFLENGISEDRITVINNGADKPLNIDLSKSSLKLNRRSDVFFSNYYCDIEINFK